MEQQVTTTHTQALLGSQRIPITARRSAEQTLHFPTPMLRDIERQARRLDEGIGHCLRLAWNLASSEIGDTDAQDGVGDSRLLQGRKRPQPVELPLITWHDVTVEAERQDRSRSWMLQRAWLLARRRLLAALR
jgi:uncharacterized small protein (TIGR04563 family)